MLSAARAVATVTVAAAGAGLLVYYLKKRRTLLPVELLDRKGEKVIVRLAVEADVEEVKNSIADQTGTGSGVGNDNFLIQEFQRMSADPAVTVLFAVRAETGKGVGMMAVVWSAPKESYWQSLRVAESCRGHGIGKLLFNVAARLAVERQGPDSMSRWGVVSNNESMRHMCRLAHTSSSPQQVSRRCPRLTCVCARVLSLRFCRMATVMTTWSARLKLAGPDRFRRHSAMASAEPPTLPAGYVLREATMADVPRLMARLRTFPVWNSPFGAQNFVVAGWASFSEAALIQAVQGVESRGIKMPAPRLLLDAAGAIVGFISLARIRFGDTHFLMHRYADGTPEGLELLMHCLPSIASANGCQGSGGYVPTLEWLLDIFARSTVWKRATATEQHEFHWKNADYV